MIDVQSLYESLDEEKKTDGWNWREKNRGYLRGENEIPGTLAGKILDEAGLRELVATPSNPYTFDEPTVMIKACRFEGEDEAEDKRITHLILAVYGQVSDKKYRRTISLDDGELEGNKLASKARTLQNQIEEAERSAKLEKQDNEELFNNLYSLLSKAFGEENVDNMHYSSTPIQLQVKKNGSIRLNMNDLDAASAMKLAEFVAESDLDLDL
jgi:hypothetical protein